MFLKMIHKSDFDDYKTILKHVIHNFEAIGFYIQRGRSFEHKKYYINNRRDFLSFNYEDSSFLIRM